METAILAAISTILGVIETVLPAVSGATSSTVIVSLVGMLEKWVPIVLAEMPSAVTLFDSIKGAIAALSANPATPAAQLQTLQQLDAQVDTGFETAAGAVDPDAPTATAT
jgi:hypothetical protein